MNVRAKIRADFEAYMASNPDRDPVVTKALREGFEAAYAKRYAAADAREATAAAVRPVYERLQRDFAASGAMPTEIDQEDWRVLEPLLRAALADAPEPPA